MIGVFALAFLAVAGAAIIELPKTIIDDDIKFIDPMWTSKMFAEKGMIKPMFDDISAWGKTIGVEDPVVLNHMRSFYDKPALVFFQDPSGKVLSYFAHEGIDKSSSIPEFKSALFNLYGASDKMAINFQPNNMLGHYRNVLPGRFFQPINNFELQHFMNDMPVTTDHVTFAPFNIVPKHTDFWNKFNIEDLPMIYKEPVNLDITKKYLSESASPFTGFSDASAATPFAFGKSAIIPGASHLVSGMPFTGFSDVSAATPFALKKSAIISGTPHLVSGMPFTGFSDVSDTTPFAFGKSAIIPGASHLVSRMPFTGFSDVSAATPFGFGKSAFVPGVSHFVSGMPFTDYRSALGLTPSVKSAAYHLVKADMPYFTAAPTAFVDSTSAGFPLVKTSTPLFTAEPDSLSAFAAAPQATHYVAAPLRAASPIYNAAFAPARAFYAGAGVVPLVKTFGDVGLTPFGVTDAYKSAFTGLSVDPSMSFGSAPAYSYVANPALVKAAPINPSMFSSPSVGLTSLARSPFWNKY